MKFSKTHETIIIILIVIAAFIFWDSLFLFPIKLVSVIFHELSHALVGFISGGSITSVEITNNLGGITSCSGTNEVAVLISGYTGSLLLGIILYFTSCNEKAPILVLPLTSLLYLGFGVFFIKNSFGIISAIIISLCIFALLFIKRKEFTSLILKILSLLLISYVINDVLRDTFVNPNLYSDAVRLEQLTGVNDWIWGAGWLAAAVISLTLIIWKIFRLKK